MARSGLKLDRKDFDIISRYCENPDVSQEEIAKKLGISQPTIAFRVKRLMSLGVLAVNIGLDVFKAELHVAKVEVTATNATKIIKMFQGCPYYLNGFVTSGKNNLCLFFVAENIATLESIVDLHLRSSSVVQNVEFNIVIEATNRMIMPLRRFHKSKTPPCGALQECKNCSSFTEGRCLGCPVINQYEGKIWST